MKKSPLYAVGANIFAGGFTLGVAKHFHVLAHLEHADRYGSNVAQANFKGLEIYAPDDDAHVLRAWPQKFSKKIDLVYSNPPCAVWSTLGGASQRGFDWRLDPRLQRIKDIFALIERYQPKIWTWESVCPAFERGREFVDELVKGAAKQGYAATFVFINARWHGVAQSRKRFFLVLHKVAIDWTAPSYDEPPHAFDVIKKVKSRRMGTVAPKRGTPLEKLIRVAIPGEPLAKTYDRIFGKNFPKNDRGQAKGRLARSARRLGLEGHAGAVVSPWLWHPKEARQLSIEEFASLTGFPQDYKWEDGPLKNVRHDPTVRLMARGVMPPVGAWLAENFARAIRAGKKVKTTAASYADFRTPPGRVAPAVEVEAPVVKAKRVPGQPRPPSVPRVKKAPVDYDAMVVTMPNLKKVPTETSGEFVRHLILEGKYSDEELAAMVRRQFDGRKTTISDIAWNRMKLKKAGDNPPARIYKTPIYLNTKGRIVAPAAGKASKPTRQGAPGRSSAGKHTDRARRSA